MTADMLPAPPAPQQEKAYEFAAPSTATRLLGWLCLPVESFSDAMVAAGSVVMGCVLGLLVSRHMLRIGVFIGVFHSDVLLWLAWL